MIESLRMALYVTPPETLLALGFLGGVIVTVGVCLAAMHVPQRAIR